MSNREKIIMILKKQSIVYTIAMVYIVFSGFNIFLFSNSNHFYTILGNHSILYPFLAILSFDSTVLVLSLTVWWIVSVSFLLAASFVAIVKRKYLLLQISAFADSAFTIIFAGLNAYYMGFSELHLLMLLGGLINVIFGVYLCRYAN